MRPTLRPPRPPPPGEGDEAEGELELTLFVSCQGGAASNVPLRTDKPSVIGRDVTSDIVIPDESVSRKHAVIVPGNPPRLEDLGSTNGTFLLGREIESNVSHDFPVGSVAQIGMANVALQCMRQLGAGRASTALPPPPTMQIDGERVVVDPMMQSLYRALATVGPTTLSVPIRRPELARSGPRRGGALQRLASARPALLEAQLWSLAGVDPRE
ncbi:MAG: FHA domain-containing protein [Polyangiaceae bacterium]